MRSVLVGIITTIMRIIMNIRKKNRIILTMIMIIIMAKMNLKV